MSKIPENPVYETTIYQIDKTDPLKGGAAIFDGESEASDGFLNAGVQQLTNRTAYLKTTLDAHIGSRGAAHNTATQTEAGFMSSADKTKLNGITAGAQPNVVTSVATRTGDITLTSADVGLGNVNNTSDANKPVSTAQQTALNLKANLASPTFTGTPSGPTAAAGTSTPQLATTAFVAAAVGAGGAAVTSVAGRTGAVVLTSSDVGLGNVDNTSDVNKPVSTAAQTALNLKADLTSPALSGTPTAPTATVGTNTPQIATTAFVTSAIFSASTTQFTQIQDQQTTATGGGTSVAATYTARNINTIVVNEIPNLTLTNNAISLPAGSYYVEASAPFGAVQGVRMRLMNLTDSVSIMLSDSLFTNVTNLNARCELNGKFVLNGTKNVALQYNASVAAAGGLGYPTGHAGEVEIYTNIRFWKIS